MKGCQESEPSLFSVIFLFLLRMIDVKYHWSKSRNSEKTVNLLCLMWSDYFPLKMLGFKTLSPIKFPMTHLWVAIEIFWNHMLYVGLNEIQVKMVSSCFNLDS